MSSQGVSAIVHVLHPMHNDTFDDKGNFHKKRYIGIARLYAKILYDSYYDSKMKLLN